VNIVPADGLESRRVSFSEGAFLTLVAVLPIMQPWYAEFHGYTIPPADFLFLVAAAAAAGSWLSGRASMSRSPLFWALAAYGVALCASAAASADRAHSVVKLAGNAYLIGLAVLTMLHVRSIEAFRRALTAWLAGTVVTVAAAFAGLILFAVGVVDPRVNRFLSIHGSLPEGGYPRVMALFLNPNMYCSYLVVSMAMLITVRHLGWFRRGSMALAGAIVLAGAFSLSPGLGGLALVIAFGVWSDWRVSRPRLVTVAIVGSAIGAALCLLATTAVPVAGAPLSLSHLRPSSRMLTWIGSYHTFLSHPWFGRGLGLDVVEIGYTNPSGVYEWLTDAHNTWLSVLAQDGLVGLAAMMSIVTVLLRGARVSLASPEQTLRTGLTVAFVAGFLYQGFSGSFENTRHVWVLIGLLGASRGLTVEASKPR
jgi:O-antigen ligase